MQKFKYLFVVMLVSGCGTVQKEFGPSALLKKYEDFKDMAAQCDAKLASIKVHEEKMKVLEDQYKGIPRREWPRDDREQHNLWSQEISGMKSSYNSLAAEYNSRMAKDNYNFCEVGKLPAGASKALPRSFKPYEEK